MERNSFFILKYVIVLTVMSEYKTEKRNSQCEHGQGMAQTKVLFCMYNLGVTRCQSKHQCHFWQLNSKFEAYCMDK